MRRSRFMNTRLTVMHQDGSENDEILGGVDGDTVYTEDVTLKIKPRDGIRRGLPSGEDQVFIVKTIDYQEGSPRIHPFYVIKCERDGIRHRQPPVVTIKDSPQARVNIGSRDESSNTINYQSAAVFTETRELLQTHVNDPAELKRLLDGLGAMESSLGKDNFKEAYRQFISMAADHLTILTPVIPQLTNLLQ